MALRLGFEDQRGPLPQAAPARWWQVLALALAALMCGYGCGRAARQVVTFVTEGGLTR